ncbi:hypothetical protein HK099_008340 [Clydaea vesicula]|uniref:Uncharacterized protein n=1 Tax=Clydaea vesicula TaxID=447962 RepID=A0AAD5U7X6_9FUNG|nr:hypothetical protein HK099_008340 [Clydaea vesicula]
MNFLFLCLMYFNILLYTNYCFSLNIMDKKNFFEAIIIYNNNVDIRAAMVTKEVIVIFADPAVAGAAGTADVDAEAAADALALFLLSFVIDGNVVFNAAFPSGALVADPPPAAPPPPPLLLEPPVEAACSLHSVDKVCKFLVSASQVCCLKQVLKKLATEPSQGFEMAPGKVVIA